MSTRTDSTSTLGTAVVTGASAGLGRIYADRLARRGFDLLLVARRGDRLASIAQELASRHGVAVTIRVADLASRDDLEAVAAAIATDPAITMLVNNAGVSTFAPVGATAVAASTAMIDINIAALTRLTIAVLPGFKQRDRGTIINIGSVLAFHTLPFSSIYSGTKAYVTAFTRGVQEEVAGTKVRVQLVAPAATATEIWDLAGVPITNLDPATVMTAEHCVDAALAGLDQDEAVTLPSLEDASLNAAYDAARMALFGGTRTGQPASRYAATLAQAA